MDYKTVDLSILQELFSIDGCNLIWNKRPKSHFKTESSFKRWNKLYAGTIAGGPNGRGYLCVTITMPNMKTKLLAHRIVFAMTHGEWPITDIDHIDHDRMNNSPENLRLATKAENNKNKSCYKNNNSGVVGVYFEKEKKKWRAQWRKDGKSKNLGNFNTIDEAMMARELYLLQSDHHENHDKLAREPN